MEPQLGMEMARHLRTRIVHARFMTQDDAIDLQLFDQSPAAMVGEAGIVVAENPGPVERGRHFQQQ